MQIAKILNESAAKLRLSGSPTAELDAQVLLTYTLLKEKSFLLSHPEMPLTNAQYARIKRLVNRRKKGEPIAYITGHKEFYGLDFLVNKNVLIPRPETEQLLHEAKAIIDYRLSNIGKNVPLNNQYSGFDILDMGTGSGCMIIHLANELFKIKNLKFKINLYASDISKKALYVARKNARRHEVSDQIRFIYSDLYSNKRMPKKYDLIIANLPYVPHQVKSQKTKVKSSINFEPKIAIYAGDNGSEVIKRFIKESKVRLNDGGSILLELDPRNADAIAQFAKGIFPTAEIKVSKDLAKWERYLSIKI